MWVSTVAPACCSEEFEPADPADEALDPAPVLGLELQAASTSGRATSAQPAWRTRGARSGPRRTIVCAGPS